MRRAAAGEDRLSALPDDLILLIVGRLDTRTALSTAVLARRWAGIPRELPALDFKVSDILPPEYDRTVALRRRNLPLDATLVELLDRLTARCQMDTMRSFVRGVTSLLEADDRGRHGRRVKTLRLEFFQPYHGICADRMIAAAVGEWGVDDLEIMVRPAYDRDDGQTPPPAYSLPHDCLNLRTRVRSLTLAGKHCALPPLLHSYGALTRLVLRDMPDTTPVDAYEAVFRDCTQLQVLHLTSCECADIILLVDAPRSQIRELVFHECSFMMIDLRRLPMLVRLACRLTDTAKIAFGSVPCLMDTNLTFCVEDEILLTTRPWWVDKFDSFLLTSPTMARSLVIKFTSLRRWIAPIRRSHTKLPGLKRLLVADLPCNWDILWPHSLLMAAPSLEVMHVHAPRSETEPDYLRCRVALLKPCEDDLRHHHLKELVMVGFKQRHIWLLKYVVSMCASLRHIVLLKDGHVQYDGLWAWQIVRKQTSCPWSHDEKHEVRRVIKKFGIMRYFQLILG